MSSAAAIDIQAAPQPAAANPVAATQNAGSSAGSGDFAQALQQASQQQSGMADTPPRSSGQAAAGKGAQGAPQGSSASSATSSTQQTDSAQPGNTRSTQADAHGNHTPSDGQGGGKQGQSGKSSKQQETASSSGNPLPPVLPILPQFVPRDSVATLSLGVRRAVDSSGHQQGSGQAPTGGGTATAAKQSNAAWPAWLTDKIAVKITQEVASTGAATDMAGRGKPSVPAGGAASSQSLIALLQTGVSASASAPATPSLPVAAAPGGGAPFAQTLGNQVSWMIGQGQQAAQLQLNPPQLGPLQISIQIQGDQTQILFQTHHALVKSALDAAVPQLREMLGQTGTQQVSVSVQQQALSSHQFGHGSGGGMAQQGYTGGNGQPAPFASLSEEIDGSLQTPAPVWSGMGLVDAYA